jgi:hypothetical protein
MSSIPHPPQPDRIADPQRLHRRRAFRLQVQSLIAVSYGVDAFLLLLFHLAETVPSWVPAAMPASRS